MGFGEKLYCVLHSAGVQKDAVYDMCKPTDSSTAISHSKFYEMGLKTKVATSVILSFLIDNQT